MTAPPTRAAIYARVSREGEAGILENQVRDLRDLAARHGYAVAREYVEIASGADDGRTQLNALLHDAALLRGRPWDVVLFRSLSRMTRTGTLGALDLLRRLDSYGAQWRFLETPMLDSTSDTPELVRNVMLTLVAELDRDYRERISKATRAAFERKKALAKGRGESVVWGRRRKATPLPNEEATA